MPLRWEKQDNTDVAMSGDVTIGFVVQRKDSKRWFWKVSGVSRINGWRSTGETASQATAKRAVRELWARWLTAADLE